MPGATAASEAYTEDGLPRKLPKTPEPVARKALRQALIDLSDMFAGFGQHSGLRQQISAILLPPGAGEIRLPNVHQRSQQPHGDAAQDQFRIHGEGVDR